MKTKRLLPFFLLSTLLPLVLVGSGLIFSSYRELKEQNEARRVQTFDSIRDQAVHQWQLWKNTIRMMGSSKDFLSADRDQSNRLIRNVLTQFPEIRSIRVFSSTGHVLASGSQAGIIQLSQAPENPLQFQNYLKAHLLWQGPAQTTNEGYPYFSLACPLLPHSNEPGGYLLADVKLEPFSKILQSFPFEVSLWEGDQLIAHSRPMEFILSLDPVLDSLRNYGQYVPSIIQTSKRYGLRHSGMTTLIPELGWTIELSEPWNRAYRPMVLLFIRLLVGIFLIGVFSVFIGLKVSKKAEKAIAEQERLATIGQMASVVGHEIRTALAVIKNSVNYLKDRLDSSDSKSSRHLEMIEAQIKASNQILADILSFSQKRDVHLKPFSVNNLLDDVLTSLAIPSAIHVQKHYGTDLPLALTEEVEFKQAVSNVILNAVQAMEDSGRLIIETSREKNHVVVVIGDSGPGIEAHIQKRIFEPFFTTKTQGTGLGLSVVKKVMDRHEGELQIQSHPGQGTTVRLTFKAGEIVIPAKETVIPAKAGIQVLNIPLKKGLKPGSPLSRG